MRAFHRRSTRPDFLCIPSLFRRSLAVLWMVVAPGVLNAEDGSRPVAVQTTVLPAELGLRLRSEALALQERSGNAALADFAVEPGDSAWKVLGWVEQGNGEQNGLYVLATTDVLGARQALFVHGRERWKYLASPPVQMWPAVQASGQSHLLFVAEARSDEAGIYVYHTITGTWSRLGAIACNGRIEEVQPVPGGFLLGVLSPTGDLHWEQAGLVARPRGLGWPDCTVIFVYLAAVAAIGFYFYSRGKRDTASFFLGSRSIPWWAAGISLYATGTSAISLMAIPAKAYATNWLYFSQSLVGIIGSVYAACVLGPLIRRLNLTSVYEYLEMRFHPVVRSVASFICIVQHLFGRMSVVLLLPSLALSAVLGVEVGICIVVMGIVTTAYTMLGGMKAVIWTDVLQVFVMIGGALFAMGWMIQGAGGLSQVIDVAMADRKTSLLDWNWDFSVPNVWVFLLITLFGTLTWPQDQVMVQRILSTKDDKAAARSMLTLAAMALPGSFMFFAIGTLLYVYYKTNPAALNPLLTTDQVFPQFIAGELPPGVTGLIIAGIFAASMATLSSNINSIATLVSVDFYERLVKGATQRKSVWLAEWTTVITGLLGTGVALLLSRYNIRSLLDLFIAFMALFGGGFAGIYALGLFTRRANWQGAIIGIVASIAATVVVGRYTAWHVLMYGPVAIAACMSFGYLGSFFFAPSAKSLQGLTVYDPLAPGAIVSSAAGRKH